MQLFLQCIQMVVVRGGCNGDRHKVASEKIPQSAYEEG